MVFNPKEYKKEILQYGRDGKLEIKEYGRFKTINYSRITQYQSDWDVITLNCRGLIVDENWNVVGRSFPKFFNHNEKENLNIDLDSLDDVIIQEKLDGSLGLLFYDEVDNIWRISTKGSLESDQCKWAMNWYNSNKELFSDFKDKRYTYLFEIIYEENKIVCSYEKEGLYFLTAIRNVDGREEIYADYKRYPLKPMTYTLEQFNSMFHNQDAIDSIFEGFVIRYSEDGVNYKRIKFKYELYVRLHRLKEATYKSMYDDYMNGYLHTYMDNMIKIVPDEHYPLLENAKNRLVQYVETRVDELDLNCYSIYKSINTFFSDSFDESLDYYYEDMNNKNIKLYKMDLLNDSIGKKIDWYYKYFELFRDYRYKEMLPFLYSYFGGGNVRDKHLYDYFEPEFINENIF